MVQVLCRQGAWRPGSIGKPTMFYSLDEGAAYVRIRFFKGC